MQAHNLSLFPRPDIGDCFSEERRIVLHEGDTCDFLRNVPDNLATLIITSPPYNIGKEYESKTSIGAYLLRQEPVIDELVRILSAEGSLCWQVGNYVENSEVYPLDVFYYDIFKSRKLKLRNRIIWHFGHGLHASKRFSGRYETILWFTKSDKYTFNLDDVRVASKYPGKRHYKGSNRGKPSGNPLGKNPSDIWEFLAEEWERELWDIPNVKANHPEKTIHPCQFPIELVERCVLALTNEHDWVLDPYCGVGSALLAGLIHNRKVAGCDREPDYIEITKRRIQDYFDGALRKRPLGKPVYVATGREKISQIPREWTKEKSGDEW
ncbi:MAG: site-specific DNA-methyltransferase [Chloroflexi bacterium]|nr:site-specific DNA-methyltransferase [Chloroflexota bacterium]